MDRLTTESIHDVELQASDAETIRLGSGRKRTPRLIMEFPPSRPIGEYALDSLPVVLGRGDDAGIQVHDSMVSRRHCVIEETEDGLRVRDLDSMNGTFVNGRRTTVSPFGPGDVMMIGVTTFEFLDEQNTGPDPVLASTFHSPPHDTMGMR